MHWETPILISFTLHCMGRPKRARLIRISCRLHVLIVSRDQTLVSLRGVIAFSISARRDRGSAESSYAVLGPIPVEFVRR